jgi:hypothetical protein
LGRELCLSSDSNTITSSTGSAKFYSRSHDASIRVYDEAGNVIETHEHKGDFKEPYNRAKIVSDCRTANDPATINKESTNENNTDVDRWADARRLRINGKPCSKPWRCLNPNMRLPETLVDGPLLWLRRRCKRISS